MARRPGEVDNRGRRASCALWGASMMALLAFVIGLLLGAWAAASRLRGDRTWSETFATLAGRQAPEKPNGGGGGGPSEPL